MSDVAPSTVQELLRLLPGRLSGTGIEVLDLDGRIASSRGDAAQRESPPLPFDDRRFDLIFSLRAFSEQSEESGSWLAEVERLLADRGLFVAAIPGDAVKGRPDPGREWIALRKREAAEGPRLAGQGAAEDGLAALLAELDADHRREIDALRESFHRELMRKSYRIAELEPDAARTPESWAIAERVAATYEATLSWRLTGPIRAAKRALARR